MRWEWKAHNSELYLIAEGEKYFPSAEEIYLCLKGTPPKSLPDTIHSPKEDLPGIRFSTIGVDLKLNLKLQDQKIFLSCEAWKNGKSVSFMGPACKLPESAIIGNIWVYFSGSREEISNMLMEAKIDVIGEISLTQYIALSKAMLNHPTVIVSDSVREYLNEHPQSGDKTKNLASLNAKLYPYQEQGYEWLRFMSKAGCGCILADEMGLGKTLQVIALIVSRLNEVENPALIIAPVSLLENWYREFEKFTTGVKILIHHGSKRTGLYKNFLKYNVVIISYNTAISDLSILQMVNWSLLVLDEAQNIKNPEALRTKSVKQLKRDISIAVTGTPFENHISDLWSEMDFIIPGCMGTLSDFSATFPDDIVGARRLEPILTPLMIRRHTSDVAQDLPRRVDVPQVLELTDYEADLYEQERLKIIETYGTHASLPMLQKLRMYCTHPSLEEECLPTDPCENSTKYQRLCELIDEISEMEEKVILFTSFNQMFSILQNDIPKRFNIPVFAINGMTPTEERQKIIDRFSEISGSALLVLNPKAAGVGLNITAASRVIHYNLEWNPSLEDQASARAYRRGQTKTVFIYRLYYKDTVEEVINERIEKKREMSEAAVIGTTGEDTTPEDIVRALTMSPKKGENLDGTNENHEAFN